MITSIVKEAKGWIPYGVILCLLFGGDIGMPNNKQPNNSYQNTAMVAMANKFNASKKSTFNADKLVSKHQQKQFSDKVEFVVNKVMQGPDKIFKNTGQYGYS